MEWSACFLVGYAKGKWIYLKMLLVVPIQRRKKKISLNSTTTNEWLRHARNGYTHSMPSFSSILHLSTWSSHTLCPPPALHHLWCLDQQENRIVQDRGIKKKKVKTCRREDTKKSATSPRRTRFDICSQVLEDLALQTCDALCAQWIAWRFLTI